MCCCNWWALTLRTVCLNTEGATGIWHSWLKYFNCWWKAVKILIYYSCIFNVQLHVHFKKWTLKKIKFKLLYLQQYSYTKSESLAQIRTTMAEIQLFSRGLFFIGAPCILFAYLLIFCTYFLFFFAFYLIYLLVNLYFSLRMVSLHFQVTGCKRQPYLTKLSVFSLYYSIFVFLINGCL